MAPIQPDTLADIQSIQQAIRRLARIEREDLAEWILNSPVFDVGVNEPALAYGGRRLLTVEEYLVLEEDIAVRHEYVAGQIFAMSSPLIRHELITANLLVGFQNQLRGGPCKALSSHTKVRMRVQQDDIFYMPDMTVFCGPFTEEMLDQKYLTNPCVIVEVLSASTEAIDRREKALNYRHIPSLEEYLLVAQRTMEVTILRRSENWIPQVLTAPQDVYESRAVEVNITLADIYEGVRSN
jgi:Uma2 family endonuclease